MVNFLSSLFPVDLLVRLSGQRLFLPFYHAIRGNQPLPHIRHLYRLRSVNQFEKDLDFLLKYFQPVSLQQLLEHVQIDKPLPERSFFLSFDDGLREVFDIAVPILERKGIPATVFLNSAFIDNKDLFFRYKASLLIDQVEKKQYSTGTLQESKTLLDQNRIPGSTLKSRLLNIDYPRRNVLDHLAQVFEISFPDFLKRQKPYLTSLQIQSLIEKGYTFGGHSIDHPLFNQLSQEEQLFQMEESIQFVQQKFKLPYKVFSFPFTDYKLKADLFNFIKNRKIADHTFGCAGLKKEQIDFHLQRFPMEGTDSPARHLLINAYIYYLLKALIGKNTIHR